MTDLAVITAGGHAIDVGRLATDRGWVPVFYDDDPNIGDHPRWRGRLSPRPLSEFDATARAVIGHNEPRVREELAARFPDAMWASILFSHPETWGDGCVVARNVTITERVTLGSHVHVNVGATISQSTTIGSWVTISPGAHLCGDVTIGARTWIGAGAIVKDHVRIGSDVLVGCGAVVVADIPDGAGTVVGVPARPINDHSARQRLAAQDRLAGRT